MSYYNDNWNYRLDGTTSVNSLAYVFLRLIDNSYRDSPTQVEEKWYQEASSQVMNKPNIYFPYLIAYDTSFFKKVNYRILLKNLYQLEINDSKGLWMIVESLQALDKMIYEEYRNLINHLKTNVDRFIQEQRFDSFLNLVIVQSLINGYLPFSYEKHLKEVTDDSLQNKLVKQLIIQYEKRYKI